MKSCLLDNNMSNDNIAQYGLKDELQHIIISLPGAPNKPVVGAGAVYT